MKSAKPGKGTSPAKLAAVEVANVSRNGFWLLVDDVEHFLAFDECPWFREATIGALTNVARPQPHHLHWPDLDVDLAVESLAHPERFPLVSRASPKTKPVVKRTTRKRSNRGLAPGG